MRAIRFVPFLGLMLIAYNLLMFTELFTANPGFIKIPLLTNDGSFMLRVSEAFAMVGVIALYMEIVKATRTSRDSIVDHMLSTFVLVICLIEFLAVARAGTSTFLILTLLALMDVVAGFTITISGARRDVAFGGGES